MSFTLCGKEAKTPIPPGEPVVGCGIQKKNENNNNNNKIINENK